MHASQSLLTLEKVYAHIVRRNIRHLVACERRPAVGSGPAGIGHKLCAKFSGMSLVKIRI